MVPLIFDIGILCMASEVDICNFALAHLGDDATVASINPPEGSAQAEHCARFYPAARDTLLEMHTWGFATHRVSLALMGGGQPEWIYAYAQPANAVRIITVIAPDATTGGGGRPQPFSCEVNTAGIDVILTDQVNAMARYIALVTDTTRFSPLFVTTLSWHLASMLAGPLIKGEAGAAESRRCSATARSYLAEARNSDASQRKVDPDMLCPGTSVVWIGGR